MIWIDASFAIEWYLNSPAVARITLPPGEVGMVSQQYAETLVFFRKQDKELSRILNALSPIRLIEPNRTQLLQASELYVKARREPRCKASLADAILASMVLDQGEVLFSLDQDFRYLSLRPWDEAKWRV